MDRFWLAMLFSMWFFAVAFLELGRLWFVGSTLLCVFTLGGLHVVMIPAAALYPYLLWEFVSTWRNCFTLGEASVVASSLSLFVAEFGSLLNRGPENATDAVIFCALMAVVNGCTFLIRPAQMASKGAVQNFYVSLMIVIVFVEYPMTFFLLRQEPFVWIWKFCTASTTRITLFLYWCGLLAVTLFVYPPHRLPWKVIVSRKYYHVLAVVMFLPALLADVDFLRVSLAVALAGLFLVELLCIAGTEPVGAKLKSFMSSLADKRDRGIVTLSHMYLLVGCAFPIWLDRAPCDPATLCGIESLGVYDAIASAIGSRWGKTRISGTRKTVEGMCSGLLASLIFVLAMRGLSCNSVGNIPLLFTTLVTMALFEVYTTQIDNLVLPLFYYASVHTLYPQFSSPSNLTNLA